MTDPAVEKIPTLSLIAEDWRTYHRPFLQQGFWAVAIHRYGSWARKMKFRPLYLPLRILHLFLIKISEIVFGIHIGPNAVIGRRCKIEHFGSIVIHSNARIGDDVQIRQGVTIGNLDLERANDVPNIRNRVSIGAGAKVLGPINIYDDVIIGANAVVIRSVRAGHLAVGIPAVSHPRSGFRHDG